MFGLRVTKAGAGLMAFMLFAGLFAGLSLGLSYGGAFTLAKYEFKSAQITARYDIKNTELEKETDILLYRFLELVSVGLSIPGEKERRRALAIVAASIFTAGNMIMRMPKPAPLSPKPSKSPKSEPF